MVTARKARLSEKKKVNKGKHVLTTAEIYVQGSWRCRECDKEKEDSKGYKSEKRVILRTRKSQAMSVKVIWERIQNRKLRF